MQRILHRRSSRAEPLASAVARATSLDPKHAQDLIELGAVYVLGKRRTCPNHWVSQGELLRVHTQPRRFPIPERIEVIAANEDYLVAIKPMGLPTHPTLDNHRENALSQLQKQDGPLLLTHRLDQMTEGLIVFARTREFQRHFHRLLAARQVFKFYLAKCEHSVPTGRHDTFIRPSPHAPKMLASSAEGGGYACSLIVHSCVRSEAGFWTVGIELLTGRTHQIRAQLAQLGAPLVGDHLYGSTRPLLMDQPVLLSGRLSWPGLAKPYVHPRIDSF